MGGQAKLYGEIEIQLYRTQPESYGVQVSVIDPGTQGEVAPVRGQTNISTRELLPLTLDPINYGRKLTEHLFHDPAVREFYRINKATLERGGTDIRLRLLIDPGAAQLQTLRWELLVDPDTGKPLANSQRILFSRFMVSSDRRKIELRSKTNLKAIIAVSAPNNVAEYRLKPVDKADEVARAREALAGIREPIIVGENAPCTTIRLIDALREGCDVLYLVCHGAIPTEGMPCLYLQDEQGNTAPVTASQLAQRISELAQVPRLVVLASCESAGHEDSGYGDESSTAQTALAPLLTEAGVPAVIAMQGKISMETVKRGMPVLFGELLKHGQIDRAMAAARGAVFERPDSWMPALFLRLKDGRIWKEERVPASLDERNRFEMLKRVRSDWIDGVLKKSLYEVARIELGLQTTSDAVEPALSAVVQSPDEPPIAVPAGIGIGQLFQDSEKALLILGAPGTGKTTLLLELTRDLLDRAEEDDSQPIPVVFNLSSWAVRRQDLARWLVAELNERSLVPRTIAQKWVDTEQVIPLLDGLDEVAGEHRRACLEAINAFRHEHGFLPIAVCSRIADYESLGAKLNLRSAVVVKPMSRPQVQDYLEKMGEPLAPLRADLQNEPVLWELLDSPLMLWVAVLAYRYSSVASSSEGSVEERRTRLFANFVDAMFKRRAAETRYTRQQFLHWLSWLGGTLKRNEQTVLYLENLRAKWLSMPLRLLAAAGSIATCGALFGLLGPAESIASATDWIAFSSHHYRLAIHEAKFWFSLLWIAGAMFGFIGVFVGVRPVEKLRFSLSGLSSRIGRAFAVGVTSVVLCGFATLLTIALEGGSGGFYTRRDLLELFAEFSVIFLIGGLLVGVPIALISLPFSEAVEARTRPNQGTIYSTKAAISAVGIVGVCVGLGMWMSRLDGFVDSLTIGFLFGLFLALFSVGGLFALKHYVLRLVLWASRSAPLNYVNFLDAAADRLFLRKVGGGYIFTHRMILEYFASLPPDGSRIPLERPRSRAVSGAS